MGTSVYDLVEKADAGGRSAGWSGGNAPAIPQASWPRSPTTGHPMIHLLTLELPLEYRRKGDDLVAISLFQADDHVASRVAGAAREVPHPHATPLEDIIGGHFMLIWLTESELRGPRTTPPTDDREPHRKDVGQELNAWDHTQPEAPVYLVERAFDPNAGKAPTEARDTGYVDVILAEDPALKAFYNEVHVRSHLGGTCLPVQAMPDGLTPFFLELDDGFGGANFGGGNMQLDLESGVFDWAC